VVVQPEKPNQTDINIVYPPEKITTLTATRSSKTLTITVVFAADATSEEIETSLDSIQISYPVKFTATKTDNLKTPIKVVYSSTEVSVENNTRLGMKHDAYITPIDLRGLINPCSDASDTIYKYVVFEQENRVYVCKADSNNYCWIPAAITSKPGM
jgi:hypothetical protein